MQKNGQNELEIDIQEEREKQMRKDDVHDEVSAKALSLGGKLAMKNANFLYKNLFLKHFT